MTEDKLESSYSDMRSIYYSLENTRDEDLFFWDSIIKQNPQNNLTILEAPCGSGRLLQCFFSEKIEEIHFLDSSHTILSLHKNKTINRPYKTRYIEEKLESIVFNEATYDLIIVPQESILLLNNLVLLKKVVQGMLRSLFEKGRLYVDFFLFKEKVWNCSYIEYYDLEKQNEVLFNWEKTTSYGEGFRRSSVTRMLEDHVVVDYEYNINGHIFNDRSCLLSLSRNDVIEAFSSISDVKFEIIEGYYSSHQGKRMVCVFEKN